MTSSAVSGCAYVVVDSMEYCRLESEKMAGFTVWMKVTCIGDKDLVGPLRKQLKEGKAGGG